MDLTQLGAQAAAGLEPEGRMGGRGLARSIRRDLEEISAAQKRESGRQGETSTAAEWLLDNWYLAQREGRTAQRALKKAPRRLRQAGKELYIGCLARTLSQQPGGLNVEALDAFLSGVQQARPLSEVELAYFIPALKGALVRRLAALCIQLDEEKLVPAKEMEAVFTALRTLSGANLSTVLEKHSQVERLLSQDPAGEYAQMDDETRARYRERLCALARRAGLSEREAADKVLALCRQSEGPERHVGCYLFHRPLGAPERRREGGWYIAAVVLPTLFVVLLLGFYLHSWAVTALILLPVSDAVKNLLDFLAVHLVPPRPVCRMALEEGIPARGRTLCVIAGLLSGAESGREYAALLERYRLANRDAGEELRLGLLADLPDSPRPMDRQGQDWVDQAVQAVNALNEKYGGGFFLFFRRPAFQSADERWLGWERKRGALLELCRVLRGRKTSLSVCAGDRRALKDVKFVITLDSDTALNVGAARELVGAMLHPLNRAVTDPRRRVVVSGYGLLQPRVGVELNAANRSQFARIFAGQGGVDPYGSTASDVYHDLFDQGTYTGKGIFDVDAFLTCLEGRFPENQVLSHDLLEGSYLHAGLIGDVELTDSYPYKVTSYFARLHRWVRGDWQLLPWLRGRVRDEAGAWQANPIPVLAKWKIFDNLRRSVSPVCTLLALLLGMCLSGTDFAVAAGCAVAAAASNLLLSGAELVWRGGRGLRERYRSTIIAGFGGALLQTLVQLLFLPIHAWTCASAICTALWRQWVSHRGLLAWVTAADAERQTGDGIGANYRRQWPAVVSGLVAVFFSRLPAGTAAGLVWTLSPLLAWAMSRPLESGKVAPVSDRAFLLHQGALIWQYFADWLRPEDHWLPPDNVQEEPGLGPARRTSPTNVGMALLSCLAAADLELCSRDRSAELISHMLDTLERLDKWHGHLYNWYDTASAQPLEPRYVSTVDSGNLCACLIALREGLYEWGRDTLARRAETLADEMGFSRLYDKDRRLFYIGWDAGRGEYTQGWYDLMASEARQTSYIAVARGEVSPRHWRRLSRMLVGEGDFRGMASWTGTMFEYFMPNLLLPVEPNSLMYESLAFCLDCQKRRGAKAHVPWGISESCFYGFDPGLSYQYKAHGVQRLGLKRGLDSELVVAPYASFLALLLAPSSAGRNLRRLRDLGVQGRYGLYEAVDFTPARQTREGGFQPVRTFMSHHLGMSLVAVDNALNNNIMQVRFMRDCSMGAFRELLQEKVPVGAAVLKNALQEVPEKPKRFAGETFARECLWTGEGRAACHLVSNGTYSVLCAADGWSWTRMGSTALTTGRGLSFWLSTPDELVFLQPQRAHFDSGAAWSLERGRLSFAQTLRVPEGENAQLREITLRWRGEAPLRGELVCYLEPVLAKRVDYLAHPAFSKLFLESAFTGDGVLFTRRPRRPEEGRAALAVAWDGARAFFDTSRETALGRGGLRALRQALSHPAQSSAGAVLDPCLLLRFPVALKKGESLTIRLAMAAGQGAEETVGAARRVLYGERHGENRLLEHLISSCKLDSKNTLQAFELLSALVFQPPRPKFDQRRFWPYGISGDLPVAALPLKGEEETEKALFWLGCHKLLTQLGWAFDLVFLLDEGGDYRRPSYGKLLEALKEIHWDHKLGARGGVHVTGPAAELLEGAAAVLNQPWPAYSKPARDERYFNFTLKAGTPIWEWGADGTFSFSCDGRLPPVGWSQMLTNGCMGWMVDETGCGHLWQGNARENSLTEWKNDPLAVGGPERLFLVRGEERRSLFADGDGLSCRVTYGPGFARWEKSWGECRAVTTAFVPIGRDVRVLLIEWDGEPCRLLYRIDGKGEYLYSLDGTAALCTGPGLEQEQELSPPQEVRKWLNRTVMYWNRQVSALKVHTPDPALDRYLNGWCLYQVIACRLLGRTSRYQNGGAYGFRDQLQDVSALLLTDGALAREQILRCCAHQFREGDVQHWWHDPIPEEENQAGKGVRTCISDDLLWLPYVLCDYLERRGDWEILEEQVPFLEAPPLRAEEKERYEQPRISQEMDSVYRHACRAVECFLARGTGEHGLALIGSGDWNDGMDRVGAGGRGESTWLSWFASLTLERFASVCAQMGEEERARRCREAAQKLSQAADAAWDGAWFLRGYYDDGTPLGSHESAQCQIDSIAQSWAALAPGGDWEKARRAVRSAVERLFDRAAGVVKLFDPPFDGGERDPGYISGYVPGVRENGGQYTHGAVWLALACFRLDMPEEGRDILAALLPERKDPEIYRAEPYVLCADVYANPAHLGRGGWSWYTGAAGWFYRAAMEELLGFRLRAGRLFVEPSLPADWPGFTALWRTQRAFVRVEVKRGGKKKALLDGKPVQEGVELERLEGEHTLEIAVM